MKKTIIEDVILYQLPKIENYKGNITPINSLIDIPFNIKRLFYIYNIPGGENRGAHAHIECHQLIIAASGSFEIHLDDGLNKKIVYLNRPYYGLHIPPGIWASEKNFSSGAICLVLTSHTFDETDYIRNYSKYKKYKKI